MEIRLKYISYIMVILGFLTGCSGGGDEPGHPDNQETGEPVTIKFNLSARNGGETRGEGVQADAEDSRELIHDWFIVFAQVDKDGNPGIIRKIVSHTEDNESGVEVSEVTEATLPPAEYFVFAFANLSQEDYEKGTGVSFKEGISVPFNIDYPSDDSKKNILFDASKLDRNLNGWTGNIPMSGVRRIKVSQNNISETYSIEVVRMLAKVKLQFRNYGSSDVKLKGVTLKQTNTGPLYLFGNYTAKETSWQNAWKFDQNSAPTIVDTDKMNGSFEKWAGFEDGAIVVSGKTQEEWATETEIPSVYAYIGETLASAHPTGKFHLEFKVERISTNGNDNLNKTEDYTSIYSLGPDGLIHINRNDYIMIPIAFTDWMVMFDVKFYPPIGGYPAVQTERDVNEYYFKFGSPGTFAIIPKIRKISSDGSYGDWLGVDQLHKLEVRVESGENIFENVPSLDPVTGEIIGELKLGGNEVNGMSEIRLTFKLDETSLCPERKIYIIRE